MSQLEMDMPMPEKPFDYQDYILLCAMGAVNDAYTLWTGYCERYDADYQKADAEINIFEFHRVSAIVHGGYMCSCNFTYNYNDETLWTIRWGCNRSKAWYHVTGHGLFRYMTQPTKYIDIRNPPYATEFMRRIWIAGLIVAEVMPNKIFTFDDQDVPDRQLMWEENHCFPYQILVSDLCH